MPQLHANGASIHYEVEGAGPPLLLIAGIASDSASWRPLVPLLAPTVSLVLIDNRGCGRTKADGPLSVVDMVSDCAALLDHLGPGTVNVLGHSLGGYLGLLLAAQHPHRVRRLVTLATGPLGSRSRALFRQLARLYPQMPPEDWFRLLFPWLFSDPFFASETSIANAAAASTLYPYRQSPADFARQVAALDTVPSADLSQIRCPVLALAAEGDLLAPPEGVRRTHATIPDVRHVEVADAAHSVHWEAPEKTAAAVLEFLAIS